MYVIALLITTTDISRQVESRNVAFVIGNLYNLSRIDIAEVTSERYGQCRFPSDRFHLVDFLLESPEREDPRGSLDSRDWSLE